MDALISFGLQHALVSGLVAIVVLAISTVCRNPYVMRALWIAVLLKFIIPPLFVLDIRESVPDWPRFGGHAAMSIPASESIAQPPFDENVSPSDRIATPPAPYDVTTAMVADVNLSDRRPSLPTDAYSAIAPLRVVGAIWLFGTFCFAGISLRRIRRFHRMLGAAPLAATELQRRLAELAGTLGVSRIPLLRVTDASVPPLAWCVGRRATILLPSQLVSRLAESTVTAILAHEIMHIRRHDGWVRWLEFAAVSLYWWCPLAWAARRKLQEVEERCCDADVLCCFPMLRARYGEALLDTVEFLTNARAPAFAGTGFGTHKSLKRRFEMLVSKRLPVRPRRAVRFILFLATVAAVSTAPMVSSWAESDEPAEAVPVAARCTVSLDDGRLIEGEVVTLGSDLIVIKLDNTVAEREVEPHSRETPVRPIGTEEIWELSLGECVRMVLSNNRSIRVVTTPDQTLILAMKAVDANSLEFRQHVENVVRDVEDAYWVVWLAHHDLEAVKDGRNEAQNLWRSIAKSRLQKRYGAADEARCRILYFQFRDQVESQLTDLYRCEERLRYLLHTARFDGRVIKPADQPQKDRVEYDWNAVQESALKNRVEYIKQKGEVKSWAERLDRLEGSRRESSEARHLELGLAREKAVLRDLALEISHQIADAIRDVDVKYGLMQTNHNQVVAAQAELVAVKASYRSGIASLDLLLDAIRRSVEASRAHNSARSDYARAVSQVEFRKGSLLARHGLKIADENASE